MAISINTYKFNKVCQEMKNDFGAIRKGDEERYSMLLFPMEGNLLKIRRANPSSNSRRLAEAIPLVLFKVKGYLEGEEYDLSAFESEENLKLAHALLMAFDPLTNDEIRQNVEEMGIVDLSDKAQMRDFYKLPVQCILRIMDSVGSWEKRMGSDGYFTFTEQVMGRSVHQDEGMKYSILG